ncbi:MAG: DUF1365 domain-containing protein [Candidatus Contendobacter sp.]|nr:DUF1365 domain-containing protein [Candidatus Contendobacter sp.]MDG4558315.1 DUF1365 domain-containing protein [Candidatus Contendobacter sp.]
MNSCLYVGHVRHRRFLPRRHEFRYGLFMVYLDLAELDMVFNHRWLWSASRPALAWFRRADHFGDPNMPLDTCVRDLVERETGRRPQGSIRLLTHLRYFGYCINPISIYYCFAPDGGQLDTLVAEVTNTPWGEKVGYVLDVAGQAGGNQRAEFSKAMHVSPFMPMDLRYGWRSTPPGSHLAVHLDVLKGSTRMLDATLSLRRQPLDGRAMAGALARFPFMTLKVVAAIYWEALRLLWKRIPIFPHPSTSGKPMES